jgi:drug/metabolite transporter (DMT)-like permease
MKIAIAFVAMITCTVAANLLMKLGATSGRVGFGWINVTLLFGLFVFGLAALIYAWILGRVPLNIAQSFAAVQFIAIILASAIVLAEDIPAVRWVGIALIACGIVLVAWTNSIPAKNSASPVGQSAVNDSN